MGQRNVACSVLDHNECQGEKSLWEGDPKYGIWGADVFRNAPGIAHRSRGARSPEGKNLLAKVKNLQAKAPRTGGRCSGWEEEEGREGACSGE